MKKILALLLIIVSLTLLSCDNSQKIRGGGSPKKIATNNDIKVNYYFTRQNQHPDQQLINIINSSDVKLDIAIYSLNKQSIVDAIINAKNRGVDVKIITDRTESKNTSELKELKELQSKGIPIKINAHAGLMNLRLTIEDNTQVATGSYNYTEDSSKENDEVLIVINDVTTAQNFENTFNTMWNNNKDYTNY